jgi:hypothetical protein
VFAFTNDVKAKLLHGMQNVCFPGILRKFGHG